MKIEVWKSDQNQEEIHLFMEGEQNEYIIGYNPKYVAKEKIEALLREINEVSTKL